MGAAANNDYYVNLYNTSGNEIPNCSESDQKPLAQWKIVPNAKTYVDVAGIQAWIANPVGNPAAGYADDFELSVGSTPGGSELGIFALSGQNSLHLSFRGTNYGSQTLFEMIAGQPTYLSLTGSYKAKLDETLFPSAYTKLSSLQGNFVIGTDATGGELLQSFNSIGIANASIENFRNGFAQNSSDTTRTCVK